MRVEIMDTTLRDGEQTSGVAYSASEKLNLAKMLLEDVKVDRIEVASARISDGEREAVKKIMVWAQEKGFTDKVEILGFIDGGKSLEWIKETGGKVVNLLCKGSLHHLEGQLRKSPEEHVADIKEAVDLADQAGISVNLYLEDWSNGMINSKDYVFYLLNELKETSIKRFMLPDTLGVLNPLNVAEYFNEMLNAFPDLHFDSHLHNDYDLAIGNTFSAIRSGAKGIHTTVNGLGERAGNTSLASAVALIKDQLPGYETGVDETQLNKVSNIVAAFSGIGIPANKPVVGEHVFTQTCGVHADGDNKGGLYENKLMPERFGRVREYALGKTSGKASILANIQDLGITLSPENLKRVTERVVQLGDQKEDITKEDLPFIISDVLGSELIKEKIKVTNYFCSHVYKLKPVATLAVEIDGNEYQATSTGNGQYDAFMNALKSIYAKLGKELPALLNYKVSIPPGGKTDAFVETKISWSYQGREFRTRGLEPDQQAAAIIATIKMLNIIETDNK